MVTGMNQAACRAPDPARATAAYCSNSARRKADLEGNWRYMAPLVNPAASAISSKVAPSKPRWAKSRSPASSSKERVSALRRARMVPIGIYDTDQRQNRQYPGVQDGKLRYRLESQLMDLTDPPPATGVPPAGAHSAGAGLGRGAGKGRPEPPPTLARTGGGGPRRIDADEHDLRLRHDRIVRQAPHHVAHREARPTAVHDGGLHPQHVTRESARLVVDRRPAYRGPDAVALAQIHPRTARERVPAPPLEQQQAGSLVTEAEDIAIVCSDRHVDGRKRTHAADSGTLGRANVCQKTTRRNPRRAHSGNTANALAP